MAGLFFLLFLTIAHTVQSQQAMERFVDWIAKHNIKSRDDSHLAHIFNNWVDNDKYIKEGGPALAAEINAEIAKVRARR